MDICIIHLVTLLIWLQVGCVQNFSQTNVSAKHSKSQWILLTSDRWSHRIKSEVFKLLLSKMGYIALIKNEPKPGGILASVEEHRKHRHIINLEASDFYKYNYNDIAESGLLHAGDNGVENNCQKENEKIVITKSSTNKSHCLPNTAKVISDSDEINAYEDIYDAAFAFYIMEKDLKDIQKKIQNDTIKLKDETAKWFNANYNLFEKMIKVKDEKTVQVFICSNKNTNNKHRNNNNGQGVTYIIKPKIKIINCKRTLNHEELGLKTIAYVLPKPLRSFEELKISLPVIFYERYYLTAREKYSYPNAFLFGGSWLTLKYAIYDFMKDLMWNKIAVISDSDEFSQDIEYDLIEFLNKKGVLNDIQENIEGTSTILNYIQKLKHLEDVDAKIVFLNMDSDEASNMFHYAAKAGKQYIWVLRDWTKRYPASKYIGDVFTITFNGSNIEDVTDSRHNDDLLSSETIRSALYFISREYNNFIQEDSNMFSSLAELMTSSWESFITSRLRFNLELRKITPKNKTILLKSWKFNSTDEHNTFYFMKSYKRPYHLNTLPLDRSYCFLNNNKFYYDPCYDSIIITIIFVVFIFLITYAVIVIFILLFPKLPNT